MLLLYSRIDKKSKIRRIKRNVKSQLRENNVNDTPLISVTELRWSVVDQQSTGMTSSPRPGEPLMISSQLTRRGAVRRGETSSQVASQVHGFTMQRVAIGYPGRPEINLHGNTCATGMRWRGEKGLRYLCTTSLHQSPALHRPSYQSCSA